MSSTNLSRVFESKQLGEVHLQPDDVNLVRQKNSVWLDVRLSPEAQERLWAKKQNLLIKGRIETTRAFFKLPAR